jgi:hypothetical protein
MKLLRKRLSLGPGRLYVGGCRRQNFRSVNQGEIRRGLKTETAPRREQHVPMATGARNLLRHVYRRSVETTRCSSHDFWRIYRPRSFTILSGSCCYAEAGRQSVDCYADENFERRRRTRRKIRNKHVTKTRIGICGCPKTFNPLKAASLRGPRQNLRQEAVRSNRHHLSRPRNTLLRDGFARQVAEAVQ